MYSTYTITIRQYIHKTYYYNNISATTVDLMFKRIPRLLAKMILTNIIGILYQIYYPQNSHFVRQSSYAAGFTKHAADLLRLL